MLHDFFERMDMTSMFNRPVALVCIPYGVTGVERRAVEDATMEAGAKNVGLIDEPIAAAVGAGIQISRAFGEGNVDLVHKRVSSLYALSFSVGMIMLAAILPFTNQFLKLAGTPETLIAVGSRYFIVQLFTMVVTFLNNVYIAVERARGNVQESSG
jgi:hypothetical protein